MAIKRTKTPEVSKKSLPAKLAYWCNQAFTADAFSKFFDAQAKEGKDGIKSYLENNDDGFELDLTVAKSFDCEEGKVTYATRKRFDYDADKLVALIKSGAINIETFINCISTFKDKDLQMALGSKFDQVATEGYTEFLQLKATDAFKDRIANIVKDSPMADQGMTDIAVQAKLVDSLRLESPVVEGRNRSEAAANKPPVTVEKPASKALSLDDILSGKI